MEADEYRKMAAVEDRMWYYAALHARMIGALRAGAASGPLLDAGCGTGGLLRRLAETPWGLDAIGVDLSPLACALSRERTTAREAGQSGYTLRRLVRLWMSAWINFSVLPLRVATVLGLILAGAGLLGLVAVVAMRVMQIGPAFGWGSLMAALLVFSGTQLVLLGVIGEYLGRMFSSINRRPQSVVREVVRGGPDSGAQ
ncbi:MAG: hypothetical protein RIS54_1679 [Verrucomicrobiota bacterium]